ncbi:MAG: primosomal protein N' [Thermoguttaceae bacterium]|nr:primosomal protein N' [Thermoguttaceae bacterium]
MTQRSLFDSEEPRGGHSADRAVSRYPWRVDDRPPLARVVFPDGAPGFFDYLIPEGLQDRLLPGCRVEVPLGRGNRPSIGWCVARDVLPDNSGKAIRYKQITALLDAAPLLSAKQLEMAEWIAHRYLAPLGTVLEAILPTAVRSGAGTRLTTVWRLAPKLEEYVRALADKPAEKPKGDDLQLTSKQRSILLAALGAPEGLTLEELARAAKCSLAPIQTLRGKGMLVSSRVRRRSAIFDAAQAEVPRRAPHRLNPDQRKALDRICQAIRGGESPTFLLHGVTGSGKTEVYIRAIDEVIRAGRQAIVLVPEISLTPQTVRRFRERFDSIAVLHSHLTDAERHVEWSRIASGEVQVVVGARSAVFAPLTRLGLIVIDEEHENSFKQETAPRYHAREVARFRSRQEKIPLILGSATPAMESWYRQQTGEYELLSLPRRVNDLPLPHVELIDMRAVPEKRGYAAIHPKLYYAIREAIDSGGQAILLLNRRGYSTQIQCPSCGEAVTCPNCEVALTHHRTEQLALCHYCDYQIPVPNRCPKCGAKNFNFTGYGTQRLEDELARRFAGVPILRMDTDTMVGHMAHERALGAFREGRYKILLGTQMIAKGLDFPNVTLVGVINADTALYHADFRAAERTFHLITQVAGRTGRGERGGRVIVQTFTPDHRAIRAASRHDYARFVAEEFPERRKFCYPPYGEMVRLVVRGPNEDQTEEFAQSLADELRRVLENYRAAKSDFTYRLLGPAQAPFAKLRGNFRFHIHLHSPDGELLRQGVEEASAAKLKVPAEVQWIVDVDPIDTL